MVDFEEFLRFVKSQDFYSDQIYHVEHIPKRDAQYGTLEKPLRKRLQRWLENNNILLWQHQVNAIDSIRNGRNTVIVTSTASGKSLCYNIPVLQSVL
jgi:DEAD/DEAH box helicase domain-containing protein